MTRLRHEAWWYDDTAAYADRLGRWVSDELDQDRAVLVALPSDRLQLVDEALGDRASAITRVDISVLGRNPSRIIPEMLDFLDTRADRQVSFVGEPVWPGRTAVEVSEAMRHEALVNVALRDSGAHALCPYHRDLHGDLHARVDRTHPLVTGDDRRPGWRSSFGDPVQSWASLVELPPAPPGVRGLDFGISTLAAVRAATHAEAARAGLSPEQVDDLVGAASEVATNSVRHGGGAGRLTTWSDARYVVCEITDAGTMTNPLAGRRRPLTAREDGWGLWLANQLCDLVQLHTGPDGTVVRLRMRR